MKKIITATVAAGLIAGTAVAEVSTTFDFASAYVYRGVTFNDGFVFQPGIEAAGLGLPEEYGSVAVGAWANMDFGDYDDTLATSEFSEVDLYASYSLPTLVEGLDLFVGYCDYTYPYGGGTSDKEASVGAGYEISGVGLGLTYYQGIGGAINGSSYVEFDVGYGIDFTEELSGSIDAGFAFADYEGGESGLNDYDIGASVVYALGEVWSAGASLTYIGQGDDEVLPDYNSITGDLGYDVSVVGMLSLGASF
mgnify:CR=1 FL=1